MAGPEGDGRGGRFRPYHRARGRCRCRRGDRVRHQLDAARLQPCADLGIAVLRARLRRVARAAGLPVADPRRPSGASCDARVRCARRGARMNLALGVLLWTIAAMLALVAARRSRVLLHDGARSGATEFLFLLPRLTIGVIGSGFLAEMLPQHLMAQWLGPGSGPVGLVLASIAGAFTPRGPGGA